MDVTDMEAKARELWKLLDTDEPNDNQIEILGQYLTEAHNAGMEEAAKVAEGHWCMALANQPIMREWPTSRPFSNEFCRTSSRCSTEIAAAIREKIKG